MSKDSWTASNFINRYYLNYETLYRNYSNPRISVVYVIVRIWHFCGRYNYNKSQRCSRTRA